MARGELAVAADEQRHGIRRFAGGVLEGHQPRFGRETIDQFIAGDGFHVGENRRCGLVREALSADLFHPRRKVVGVLDRRPPRGLGPHDLASWVKKVYSTSMAFPLVHHLFHSWTGWPSAGMFPPEPPVLFFEALAATWKTDGLELQSRAWTPEQIQMTFQTEPQVAPVFLAGRVKGRLQHAMRQAGMPCDFSRKTSVRSLGDNRSPEVEAYLRKQAVRAELADGRYRATLQAAGFEDAAVDLSAPTETSRGRYWFNLHLVVVTADRFRIGKEDFLAKVRAGVFAWAEETGSRLKAFAPMPDHVHVAARGNPERSPMELAEALWKSLNCAAGCCLMGENVYAGTFSEYGVGAVRART